MDNFLFALLTLCNSSLLIAAPKPNIVLLVEQLGDSDYRTREAAFLALDTLGAEALPELKHATLSGNLEQVARAERLHDRISFRIENAKAIAPTYVSLDVKDMKLEDIFALLQKQTGYKHVIPVNRSVLAERFTLKIAPNTPYWEAILKICDLAKLVITRAEGFETLTNTDPAKIRKMTLDYLKLQLDAETTYRNVAEAKLEIAQAMYNRNLKLIQSEVHAVKIPYYIAENVKVAADIEYHRRVIKTHNAKIEKMQDALSQYEPSREAQPGTVKLVKVGTIDAVPTDTCGAYFLKARPMNSQMLNKLNPQDLLNLVRVLPEPGVRWIETKEVRIFGAWDIQNRNVAGWWGKPLLDQPLPLFVGTLSVDTQAIRQGMIHQYRSEFSSVNPDMRPEMMLNKITGEVRGTIWSKTEDLDFVQGLNATEQNLVSENKSGLKLQAQLIPSISHTGIYKLHVSITLPSHKMKLVENEARPEEVWFGQNLNGQLKPLARKPEAPLARTPYGLNLVDEKGRKFDLNEHSKQLTTYENADGMKIYKYDMVYIARSVDKNSTKPTKLIVRGSRILEVRVPFTLNNVPLKAGSWNDKE